jgi:hypothetical protein
MPIPQLQQVQVQKYPTIQKGLVTGGSQAILASADFSNQGTANMVLHGNASGAPSWGPVTNADIASGIDATKLADGSITNTEFQYLDGASGNIQTQINSIVTLGTNLLAGLTPNTPVRTNASNNLVSGTINLASADVTGTLPVTRGGTGLTSGTQGGIPYFNSGTTMASSGLLAQNGIMIGGGTGAPPSTIATANNGVVVTNGSGVPSVDPQIKQSNLPTGTVLLIYWDENDFGDQWSSSSAKTTMLPANTYSRIIIESEVSLRTTNHDEADWLFDLEVDGDIEESIRLVLNREGAISGSIKTSLVQNSAVPVTIVVTQNVRRGTWTVKSLRIYGVI